MRVQHHGLRFGDFSSYCSFNLSNSSSFSSTPLIPMTLHSWNTSKTFFCLLHLHQGEYFVDRIQGARLDCRLHFWTQLRDKNLVILCSLLGCVDQQLCALVQGLQLDQGLFAITIGLLFQQENLASLFNMGYGVLHILKESLVSWQTRVLELWEK